MHKLFESSEYFESSVNLTTVQSGYNDSGYNDSGYNDSLALTNHLKVPIITLYISMVK